MKQSMKKDVVVILKLFFEKFTASPWMDVDSDTYSPIPTNLNKFLRRCCQIWLCDREGKAFSITDEDFQRIHCFYLYIVKYILPLYKRSWDDFSRVESRPPAPFNGKPDLLLADFESLLHCERWETPHHDVFANPNSFLYSSSSHRRNMVLRDDGPFAAFFNETYAGRFLSEPVN